MSNATETVSAIMMASNVRWRVNGMKSQNCVCVCVILCGFDLRNSNLLGIDVKCREGLENNSFLIGADLISSIGYLFEDVVSIRISHCTSFIINDNLCIGNRFASGVNHTAIHRETRYTEQRTPRRVTCNAGHKHSECGWRWGWR